MRQKTWKKRLAIVLAASMALNAGVLTSFAKWELEDDGWHFYRESDGKPIVGKVHQVQGEWYSFDENGVMETDKRIEVDGSTFYITPGGQFAVNKWMFLDKDGHKCTHTDGCDCTWYRFGDIEEVDGGLTGGVVKDGLKEIDGSWYSFEPESGIMRSDELITGISAERPDEIFYAYQDGRLASKEWVLLDAEGHKAKDGDKDAFWYYFKNVSKERGLVRDDEEEIRGAWYAFDKDGHMIMRDWRESVDGKNVYYYQYRGERAVNKSLYIDGEWFLFNEAGVATTSDAARKRVEKIEPIGETTVKTEVGREVTLKFQLTEPAEDKASTSDAMKSFTNDHDVWIGSKIQGKFLSDKTQISADGVCTIIYKNDKVNGDGDEILLVIDDVEATKPFVVSTVLPKDENGSEITEDENTVSNIINKTEFQPGEEKEAVEQLKNIYTEKFDDEKKAAFEDQWLDEPEQFEKLEKAYKESQRIEVKAPQVAEGAKGELDGSVSVAGAAFNAPAGSTVELKVDAAKDDDWKDHVGGAFENPVPFDISLFFDGNAQSELNMPVVITIPVPKTYKEMALAELKANLKLYNIHGGAAIEVKITIKDGKISFLTDRFSTYVFALSKDDDKKPAAPNRRGSGSSGSSSTGKSSGTLSGQWMLDETGWWFRLKDGSYAVDSWQYVDYNGVARWYRFDANGYICRGWFTDSDGHRYYLNPVSDGLMGAMLTGWQQIDGVWYYFNNVSDGTQGALLVNTTTPDGYNVDANGQWIQ